MEEDPTAPDIPMPDTDIPVKNHVNRMNHQLYNILKTQKTTLDMSRTGGPRNPLTILKPLKPNAMDDYDKAVKKQRMKAREGKKFVEVRS
jgi:hypothetical protein